MSDQTVKDLMAALEESVKKAKEDRAKGKTEEPNKPETLR